MAFKKHTLEKQIPLNDFTPGQSLMLMIDTARKLNWNLNLITLKGFTASLTGNQIVVTITDETATIKSTDATVQLIDMGENEQNIELFTNLYYRQKPLFTTEQLDQQYQELQEHMAGQDEVELVDPPEKPKFGFFALFIPRDGYFVTPIIINTNILIFILMVISGVGVFEPDNASLINWGANFNIVTLSGQWWRLITNCFIHIGIFHLAFNMYALAYVGLLLEPLLGKARFAAAYLLTGLTASITSLWWHSLIISAGASGAIFGMYGVFLAMLTTSLVEKSTRKNLLSSIGVFVGYNLLYGMKQGIDNAAHVGGLISGLVIGYAYVASLKKPADTRLNYATIAVLSGFIVAGCCVAFKQIPNDIAQYDEKIKKFDARESMALEVFKLPDTTSKANIMAEIKDRGLYYWQENIDLINELDKLDLPQPVHEQDRKLLLYCNLRVKSYKLMYKAVAENTSKYKDSISFYNDNIKAVLDSLKTK